MAFMPLMTSRQETLWCNGVDAATKFVDQTSSWVNSRISDRGEGHANEDET